MIKDLMQLMSTKCPELWAGLMLEINIEPVSPEFENVFSVLSNNQTLLVDFMTKYKHEPYQIDVNIKFERDEKGTTYCPYYYYGKYFDEPIFYYNCDWYWKTLCKTSTLKLDEDDRKKLNETMKFVACNALNLDVRKSVYDSVVGDEVKKEISASWAKATIDIPVKLTELFNFCMDNNVPKMKKEKLWKEKYEWKRIRLRGKMVDVTEPQEYRYKNAAYIELIIDAAQDLTDKKFAAAQVKNSSKFNEEVKEAKQELIRAQNVLKKYEDDWARDQKNRFKNGKAEVTINGEKKKLTVKEYYAMMGFGFPPVRNKLPDEVIADQRKTVQAAEAKVAEIEKKSSADNVKTSILCYVNMPSDFKNEIGVLDKGAEVVIEGYPGMIHRQGVYRTKDGGLSQRGDDEAVFAISLSNGRLVK